LAADVGRPVSTETLVDRVWGERPPRRPREALYVYITGIRRVIERGDGAASLVRRSGGYLLDADPNRVDLHRYHRLESEARKPNRSAREHLALLRQALALWRGTPLANVSSDWASQTRRAWEREHVDTVLRWTDAELGVGDPGIAMRPLTELVDRHPLDESQDPSSQVEGHFHVHGTLNLWHLLECPG
jgi:DNA-binding SARP family transcriptional activator